MRERSVLALTAVTAAVVLSLVAVYLLVLAPSSPSSTSATEQVQFVIAQDTSSGLYALSPSSAHVAANSLVRVSIINYDPENHSVPGSYCNVTGTVGGEMMWSWMRGGMMGGYGMGPQMMGNLSPAFLSHTFTIRGNGYDVNVPIPVAHSASDPSVVNFSFAVHASGELPWTCEGAGMNPAAGGMMGAFWVE